MRIELFQVDERYVPRDHPDSNYKNFLHLLGGVRGDTRVYAFDPLLSIKEALDAYEKIIQKSLPFDLCILGLGSDGHTASLFPNLSALHENTRLVAHTTTDNFAVRDRLTMTFPAIMASKKILLLLRGKEKKQILDGLLHSNKTIDELPAKKLLEHPDLTIHFLNQ